MGSAESGTTPQPEFHLSSLKKLDSLVTNKEKEETNEILLSTMKAASLNKLFINSPGAQQYENIYEESGGNIEKFFDLIEGRISDLYISLSKQTLQLMCDRKLTNTESKVFISEEILFTSMNILKILGLKTNFKYDPLIISRLNSLQLCMLGYMKAKYPRQSQNFVPGELMQEFKNFDFVEQPENDVLRHLNVYFGEKDENKLMMQVKKFMNQLIDELDEKFPIFEQLLSQKVFVVTKQGKQYSVFNKIGRKIPENVDKLNEEDESSIDLKSPEIFRVIVKWVSDMEDYILHPEEQIKQKDHFKTVKISENEIFYDFITTDEIENQLEYLESQLVVEKQEYENSLQSLKNYIQLFNHNLIKVITKAERRQRYVPQREAEIIKYSMFNKRLLSWLIIQKLMIVLKKLIKTSETLEESVGMRLDLVKFNVTDLMRAMMVGNKFQILKVFNNLKILEEAGVLKILKIKNRLETPLNDAMIIFKISQSFLICELQLVLSDGNQSVTEKLKNIETLNHFFYELERSPYGVMAELAALLSFKDNKTNFESKITFQKISEFSLDNCRANHGSKIETQNYQKNPFICSQCTQFYGEYQNQYVYEYCQECNQYQCAKCLFSQKKYSEENLRQEAIVKKINQEAEKLTQEQENYVRTYQSALYKSAVFANDKGIINKVNDLIMKENSFPFREIAKKKNIISYKEVQKYLREKYRKETYDENTKYFSVCRFMGRDLYFTAMKEHPINGISFCFDYNFDYEEKTIQFGYFDFILVHAYTEPSFITEMPSRSNFNLFRNFSVPKQMKQAGKELYVEYIMISQGEQLIQICNVLLIIDIKLKQKKKDNEQEYEQSLKKEFQYESIEALRKNLPNLIQTQEVINLGNEGVSQEHLVYFQKVAWKSRVKYLNLHNNKISDASILVSELPSLQTLIISKNYLSTLEFKIKLPNFKKLIAFKNYISRLEGLQNISTASTINLSSNQLPQFGLQKVSFPNLRVLDLEFNQLSKFESISQKECPKLITLILNGTKYAEKLNEALKLELPHLITLKLKEYNALAIEISNVKSLENLSLEELTTSQLTMGEASSLIEFNICNCGLNYEYDNPQDQTDAREKRFMYKILENEFSSLVSLKISNGWEIYELPVLKMPALKKIVLEDVVLENIMNLTQSKLPNLQALQMLNVQVKELPVLTFPKLAQIEIQAGQISDVQSISSWELPLLVSLKISYLHQSTPISSFKNLALRQIEITGGSFRENSSLENQKLQLLNLNEVDCENFPVLVMPKVRILNLVNCCNVNLINFEKSKLQSLNSLSGTNLRLKQESKALPKLNSPTLETIKLAGCYIEDISNLSFSNIPALKTLDFQNASFRKFPPLKCSNLVEILISSCEITDLGGLSDSQLPNLTKIYCNYNNIKKLPAISFPALEEFQLISSRVEDITNLSLSKLPALKKLNLSGQNVVRNFCSNTTLPGLEELILPPDHVKDIEGLGTCHFHKLKILNLSYIQLENPKLPKLDMPALTSLNLEKSNMEDISSLEHSNLNELVELYLNYTKIAELPVLKLKKLSFIKYNSQEKTEAGQDPDPQEEPTQNDPDVSQQKDEANFKNDKQAKKQKKRTRLWSIKNLKHSDLPELALLEFENNDIEIFPKVKFPKLKKIFLTGNNITDLTEFKNSSLPSLELLNIYDNKIRQLPIGKEVKPSSLYMNQGEVESFNELVEFAPYVENFFYNQGKMPEVWPNATFKRVKIFQLNKCELKVIDSIFKNTFEKLVELSISDNQIEKVPQLFCPSLEKLYLNRNCIKDVKEFMKSELPCAKMISLESNQVEDLVDLPFIMTGQVFLSHNKFTDISFMSRYIYEGMKMLVLWDIKLVKLGKLNAPVLQKLYMNVNCIESLDSMRGSNLPKLSLVNFSENRIKDLSPLNEMKLVSIENIYISNNKITKLVSLNLPTLIRIQLKQNPISHVDEFLKSKLNLCELSVSFNCAEPAKAQLRQKLNSYPLYESEYVQ